MNLSSNQNTSKREIVSNHALPDVEINALLPKPAILWDRTNKYCFAHAKILTQQKKIKLMKNNKSARSWILQTLQGICIIVNEKHIVLSKKSSFKFIENLGIKAYEQKLKVFQATEEIAK